MVLGSGVVGAPVEGTGGSTVVCAIETGADVTGPVDAVSAVVLSATEEKIPVGPMVERIWVMVARREAEETSGGLVLLLVWSGGAVLLLVVTGGSLGVVESRLGVDVAVGAGEVASREAFVGAEVMADDTAPLVGLSAVAFVAAGEVCSKVEDSGPAVEGLGGTVVTGVEASVEGGTVDTAGVGIMSSFRSPRSAMLVAVARRKRKGCSLYPGASTMITCSPVCVKGRMRKK